MKKILLCALALTVFSCSSKQKVAEVSAQDRSVSSDEAMQKVIEFFKEPRAEFNKKASVIIVKTSKKINDLNRNPAVQSCKADSIAKRFFTNACTEALALCKKADSDPFTDMYKVFLDTAYAQGISGAAYLEGKAKKQPSVKFYREASFYMSRIVDDMNTNLHSLLESNFNDRSIYSLGPAFSGASETYDKKDDFQNCIEKVVSPLIFMDSWQKSFDNLIPR